MLKSHNWYKQNPAITGITANAIAEADKDALFVLGRNIYQSACGDSSEAVAAINDLSSFLNVFDDEIAFHILNGILFEIYFDSFGRFRKKKKTQMFDPVMILNDDEDFELSFRFIQQTLVPHQKHLFYVPGNDRDILVDVNLSPDEKN